MSLESTTKLRNNIKDLKQKVEHQEKVVSGYQSNYDSVRSEIKSLLKLVEINKKLEHEKKQEEITKLNNQKQEIFNKLPEVSGKDSAFISQTIQDKEVLQQQIQSKLDKETKDLNGLNTQLKDNKAMEGNRPFIKFSKENIKKGGLVLTAAAIAGLSMMYNNSKILSGKDSDNVKGGNEKPVPVVPPKDTSKDTTAHFRDGNKDNRDHRDQRGNRDRSDKPSKPKENADKTPGVVYRITNPDKTKDTTFATKAERDAFIKDHNLILNESNTTVPSKKNETLNVEWKLTSPDGKQTKTFATKAERDAFAREHNLQVKEN